MPAWRFQGRLCGSVSCIEDTARLRGLGPGRAVGPLVGEAVGAWGQETGEHVYTFCSVLL